MDLSFIRQGYKNKNLEKDDFNSDPIIQFKLWFEEAKEAEPIPTAMSLATVNNNGEPTLRTVLLKSFDKKGFVFFTNYKSKKAENINNNSNVAILFNWVASERQVSITGVAEKIKTEESKKYFMSRPRGSQLGAWVSNQSSVLSSRESIEKKLEDIKRKFSNGVIPYPDFWGGYIIIPKTLEFWQGRPNRLHDRFIYSKQSNKSWKIDRIAP